MFPPGTVFIWGEQVYHFLTNFLRGSIFTIQVKIKKKFPAYWKFPAGMIIPDGTFNW